MTLPEYAINSYGVSDIGCVRSVNEDVFAIVDERQFFVLADGMGGHAAGEIAASLAVDFLVAAVKETSSFDSCVHAYGFLQKSLLKANQHVWQKAAQNPAWHGMGSTLCCCLFHNNFILYGHVGDSRLYRIRSDDIIIHQLTQDHSPPPCRRGSREKPPTHSGLWPAKTGFPRLWHPLCLLGRFVYFVQRWGDRSDF